MLASINAKSKLSIAHAVTNPAMTDSSLVSLVLLVIHHRSPNLHSLFNSFSPPLEQIPNSDVHLLPHWVPDPASILTFPLRSLSEIFLLARKPVYFS